MRIFSSFFVAIAFAVVSSPAFATPIQSTGHTDIRFLYANGSASLAYYLDEGSIVDGQEISADKPGGGTPLVIPGGGGVVTKIAFQPSGLITFVPGPPIPQPDVVAFPEYAFTGANTDEPLWYIPQTQEQDRPWTGISTESVTSADFSNIRYQLTAFSGPGHMSVLQFGPFGKPYLEFQTSNGLSGDDAIDVPAHTHAHYQWMFTAPGAYTFDLTATGTRTPAAGGGTASTTGTFTFYVSEVPVPEPTSLCLLAMSSIALMCCCDRRIRI